MAALTASLLAAAKKGDAGACPGLLAAGADVHAVGNDGRTALHWCASHGHDAICGLLLDACTSIEARDCVGYHPLHLAVMFARLAACELLIARGAAVCAASSAGRTPLHLSARHAEVLALLLDEGAQASVHAFDFDGCSPLDVALFRDSIPSCQLLVAHCAPMPTYQATLRAMGLPAAAPAYILSIRDAGWQRRLCCLRNYVDTNGHTRPW